jgi:hypothetical protein
MNPLSKNTASVMKELATEPQEESYQQCFLTFVIQNNDHVHVTESYYA